LGHNPERLGSFEVEDQLELGWVLHGQIGGLRALEYAIDIERRSPPDVSAIGPIGNEASVRREVTVRLDCRDFSFPRGQLDDASAMRQCRGVGHHDQASCSTTAYLLVLIGFSDDRCFAVYLHVLFPRHRRHRRRQGLLAVLY
jgi:hypothetical protein